MMTTSLLTGERGEEVSSKARLPAELAKGGWLLLKYLFLLGCLYKGVSSGSRHPCSTVLLSGPRALQDTLPPLLPLC
jgi:hypothetical protein